MKPWLVLLTMVWLGACSAGTGGYIDNAKLKQLTVGRTTYDDVMSSWGQPTNTSTSPNGSRTVTYPYTWLETGPMTSAPGMGPVSSTETRTGWVTLIFNPGGVLQSYTTPN